MNAEIEPGEGGDARQYEKAERAKKRKRSDEIVEDRREKDVQCTSRGSGKRCEARWRQKNMAVGERKR